MPQVCRSLEDTRKGDPEKRGQRVVIAVDSWCIEGGSRADGLSTSHPEVDLKVNPRWRKKFLQVTPAHPKMSLVNYGVYHPRSQGRQMECRLLSLRATARWRQISLNPTWTMIIPRPLASGVQCLMNTTLVKHTAKKPLFYLCETCTLHEVQVEGPQDSLGYLQKSFHT